MRKYSPSNFPYRVLLKTLDPHTVWNFIEVPDRVVHMDPKVKAHHEALEESFLEKGIINPILVVTTREYSEREVERLKQKKGNLDKKMKKHRPFKSSYLKDPLWFEKDKIPASAIDENGFILVCRMLGGTRLKYAQKHNLPVPCLISDLVSKYKEIESLGHEEILASFDQEPKRLSYTSYGIEMSFVEA